MSADVSITPQSGQQTDSFNSSQNSGAGSFSNVLKGENAANDSTQTRTRSTDDESRRSEEPTASKEAKTKDVGNDLPEEGNKTPDDAEKITVTEEERALLEQLASEGDELAEQLLSHLDEDNTVPLATLEALKKSLAEADNDADSPANKALALLMSRAGGESHNPVEQKAAAQSLAQQQTSSAQPATPSAALSAAEEKAAAAPVEADTADDGLKQMLEQRLADLSGKPSPGQNTSTMALQEAPRLQQTAPTSTPTVPQTPVALKQSGWDQALTNSVKWMVNENLQEANIRVKPAELGPIQVKVSMQDEQLRLSFTATHAATREALESAMPRLREVMSASGMDLGNVDVNQEGLAKQFQQNEYSENGGEGKGVWGAAKGAKDSGDSEEMALTTALPTPESSNAVDVFA